MWKCEKQGGNSIPERSICGKNGRTGSGTEPEGTRKRPLIRVIAVILTMGILLSAGGCGLLRPGTGSGDGTVTEHYDKKTRTLSYTGDFPDDTLYMRIPEEDEIVTGRDEDNGRFEYVDRELIVLSEPGVSFSGMEKLLGRYGLDITGYVADCDSYQVRKRGEASLEDLNDLIEDLTDEDEIAFASLNYAEDVETEEYPLPNDPWKEGTVSDTTIGGSNWGVEAIQAPWFWKNYRLEGVSVGVVDTMINERHEDLTYAGVFRNIYPKGDPGSHGTHVSGIIGARYSNKRGITGVLRDPDLYATDFQTSVDADKGFLYNYILRIDLMLKNGAKVINFSLGNKVDAFSSTEEYRISAIQAAEWITPHLRRLLENGKDFILVKSAGNNGRNPMFSDAGYGWWISAVSDPELKSRIVVVGAAELDNGGFSITDFSNRGSRVDVMAPGKNIYSCVNYIGPEGKYYDKMDGTSMAAPFVTAACAALWEYYPSLSGADIKTLLVRTADIPVSGISARMINLYSAFGGYPEGAVSNHDRLSLQAILSLPGYGTAASSDFPEPADEPVRPALPEPAEPPAGPDFEQIYRDFIESGRFASVLYQSGTSGQEGYYMRYGMLWDDTYMYSDGDGYFPNGDYYIYDIDGDGIPELIMNGGISMADSFVAVFTYSGGEVRFVLFDLAAHGAGIFADRSRCEMIVYVYHGGSEGITGYVIRNGKEYGYTEYTSFPDGNYTALEDAHYWRR